MEPEGQSYPGNDMIPVLIRTAVSGYETLRRRDKIDYETPYV